MNNKLLARKIWHCIKTNVDALTVDEFAQCLEYICLNPAAAQPVWEVESEGYIRLKWAGRELCLVDHKWLADDSNTTAPVMIELPNCPDDPSGLTG